MSIGTRSRLGIFGVPRGSGNSFLRGNVVMTVIEKGFAAAADGLVTLATATDAAITGATAAHGRVTIAEASAT